MTFLAISRVTLRGLLGRRRTLLMLLLAGIPVLVGLLVRANADDGIAEIGSTLDGLAIRIVLPLVALVFGTSALGSELEDGTGVHLLTKPVPRWLIVVAKILVAGSLTAAFVVPSTVIAAILMAPSNAGIGTLTTSLAVGLLAGSYLYATIFATLSIVTSRGLIIGLGYALIWEGLLAGVLPGSQVFSVREYVRGIIFTISPSVIDSIVGSTAFVYSAIALAVALAIATYRLSTYEVRGSD